MLVPFKDTPRIIYSDIRHTKRFSNVSTFELDNVTYYVVETDYNNAVQMIKDRSALSKMGRFSDSFAQANMKFIVDNLDPAHPNSFNLMMSEFKDWTDLINGEDE